MKTVSNKHISITNIFSSHVTAFVCFCSYFQPKPYVPHEFTMQGYLQRLHYYIHHQHFCPRKIYKPLYDSLTPLLGDVNQSCTDTCKHKGKHQVVGHSGSLSLTCKHKGKHYVVGHSGSHSLTCKHKGKCQVVGHSGSLSLTCKQKGKHQGLIV